MGQAGQAPVKYVWDFMGQAPVNQNKSKQHNLNTTHT